jgi:hypothetical protein
VAFSSTVSCGLDLTIHRRHCRNIVPLPRVSVGYLIVKLDSNYLILAPVDCTRIADTSRTTDMAFDCSEHKQALHGHARSFTISSTSSGKSVYKLAQSEIEQPFIPSPELFSDFPEPGLKGVTPKNR